MTSNGKKEWPWSILEIDPTDDEATIKSAYAKILKRDRIHGDPEKFQELKEARDFAITFELVTETDPGDNKVDEVVQDIRHRHDSFETRKYDNIEVHHVFIENEYELETIEQDGYEHPPVLPANIEDIVSTFLANPWARNNLPGWKAFFNNLPLLTDAESFMLEARIANTLDDWLVGTSNFPSLAILDYLFEHFGWSSVDSRLRYHLGEMRIRRIKTVMSGYRVVLK